MAETTMFSMEKSSISLNPPTKSYSLSVNFQTSEKEIEIEGFEMRSEEQNVVLNGYWY